MHPIQEKIIKLAKKRDISSIGPRELARLLGVDHPEKAKHHLMQLRKKGLLYADFKSQKFKIAEPRGFKIAKLFNLPIVGSASCGEACQLAHEKIEGYLKVSSGIVGNKSPDGLVAVRAVGDSLNNAKDLKGGPVKDGDYVIIDCKNKNPQDGDYVLSIIDDAANLKRFYKDRKEKQIKLVSESTHNIAPIYIDFNDYSDYFVNGVVVRAIKN